MPGVEEADPGSRGKISDIWNRRTRRRDGWRIEGIGGRIVNLREEDGIKDNQDVAGQRRKR